MKQTNFRKTIRLLAALAIAMFVLAVVPVPGLAQDDTDDTSNATLQQGEIFSQVYEDVSPSVVAIQVIREGQSLGQFDFGGSPDGEQEQVSAGSGFVYDKEGHIITNNHVVQDATEIRITFLDGTKTRAEVVGTDPDSDLAVLKVDIAEGKLQPISFADSTELEVGQTVLAIGSPFRQNWTLTTGIISAVDRTIRGADNFSIGGAIQTDAAINPGNSGGPLLNLDGEVVGVNSQIVSASSANAGVGFAVPSNLTQRVVQKLIDQGFVEYSFLGITGTDVTLEAIEAFDLPNDQQGVMVIEVQSGGPAARAGLQPMETEGQDLSGDITSLDIITAVDGDPINSMSGLITYLARNTEPGQTITLSVLRDGSEQVEVDLQLTPRP